MVDTITAVFTGATEQEGPVVRLSLVIALIDDDPAGACGASEIWVETDGGSMTGSKTQSGL